MCLSVPWGSIERPIEVSQTSEHYDIEGFKGGPQLGTLYADKCQTQTAEVNVCSLREVGSGQPCDRRPAVNDRPTMDACLRLTRCDFLKKSPHMHVNRLHKYICLGLKLLYTFLVWTMLYICT